MSDTRYIISYWSHTNTNISIHTSIGTSRPGKSCKLSSSGKLRDLQCPQNGVSCDKEICALIVGVAWWNRQIFIAHTQFTALHPQFWNLNPLFFIPKSPLSNLNSPSSTLLSYSSVKSAGYLTENVHKIAEFQKKRLQAPLPPLPPPPPPPPPPAFSRSGYHYRNQNQYWYEASARYRYW